MYEYKDIRTIHLEVTQNCQASCPMCDRNQNGGALNPHINLDELTIGDVKRIFTPEFIAQLNTMYMCGNLGDPIVARDTLEIFTYFREHNPNMWLSMNTNNWDNVYRSMKAFIAAGGRARWDFLIFEHNQHQVDEAKELSQTMGFEKFVAKKTGRFISANSEKKETHQAVDRKGNQTTELKKPEEKYVNSALKKQTMLEIKYGSMDNYYEQTPIRCKVKDEGSLFITAEGLALPCCWTAGRMYKWWNKDPKQEQIWKFIEFAGGKDAINAKIHGLERVFKTEIFTLIEDSWQETSYESGRLKVCAMKCGIEFDPFAEQFK